MKTTGLAALVLLAGTAIAQGSGLPEGLPRNGRYARHGR